jgi:hypothetical protein
MMEAEDDEAAASATRSAASRLAYHIAQYSCSRTAVASTSHPSYPLSTHSHSHAHSQPSFTQTTTAYPNNMTKLLALALYVAVLAAGTDAAGASLRSTIKGAAAGAPTVCSTYVAIAGFYGCRGGELLVSTSSDGKTLEACAKYAATLKAGMFSYNPPDQHCIPFTAEQCRTKGRINLHAWCGTSTCTTTYTLYDLEAAPAAANAALAAAKAEAATAKAEAAKATAALAAAKVELASTKVALAAKASAPAASPAAPPTPSAPVEAKTVKVKMMKYNSHSGMCGPSPNDPNAPHGLYSRHGYHGHHGQGPRPEIYGWGPGCYYCASGDDKAYDPSAAAKAAAARARRRYGVTWSPGGKTSKQASCGAAGGTWYVGAMYGGTGGTYYNNMFYGNGASGTLCTHLCRDRSASGGCDRANCGFCAAKSKASCATAGGLWDDGTPPSIRNDLGSACYNP